MLKFNIAFYNCISLRLCNFRVFGGLNAVSENGKQEQQSQSQVAKAGVKTTKAIDVFEHAMVLHDRFLKGVTGGRRADLRNIDLTGKKLNKIDLRDAMAAGTKFTDCSLLRANFSKGDFFGAHFERADMRWSNLTEADVRGAFFLDTCLSGAILTEADFRPGAIYDSGSGIIDDSSIFKDGARVANLTGVNLSEANLVRAKMNNAELFAADLRGADLSDAVLDHANLRNANLEGAKVEGAKFRGARLEGANMRGVDLSDANMEDAMCDGMVTGDPESGEPDEPTAVEKLLADHKAWLGSNGAKGKPSDLSGQNLSGMNLEGFDFSGAKCVGVQF
jgi:uncharacterized protein YjbI with pentapeptide repeats